MTLKDGLAGGRHRTFIARLCKITVNLLAITVLFVESTVFVTPRVRKTVAICAPGVLERPVACGAAWRRVALPEVSNSPASDPSQRTQSFRAAIMSGAGTGRLSQQLAAGARGPHDVRTFSSRKTV